MGGGLPETWGGVAGEQYFGTGDQQGGIGTFSSGLAPIVTKTLPCNSRYTENSITPLPSFLVRVIME